MKNKTFIIAVVLVVIGIIAYYIYSSQQSNTSVSPIPSNNSQKEFDKSFSETKKIKPQSIEAVKLPDHVTSSFEKIYNGKLGFVGIDQVIYIIDLASGEQKSYDLPDSLLEESATFGSFNDDFSKALVGYSTINKVAYLDLTTSKSTVIDINNPIDAVFSDELYILSNDSTLKLSIIQKSKALDFLDTKINSARGKISIFNNKPIVASEDGVFLISNTVSKISDSGKLVLGYNSSNLVVSNEQDESTYIAFYNQSLTKVKELPANHAIKDIYLDKNGNIYLAITLTEDANDKLIKLDQDGNESEITLPAQYPDFLREFRIDHILSIDSSAIYYSDQGNVFKIIL